MKNTVDDLHAFIRTVELGGFSAAAKDLDLSPSALSKLVSRMEQRLGVRLLNRTTRKIAITPEGENYFQRCKRIIADIEEAENELLQFRNHPKGHLRMSVGVAFGIHQLVPALPEFLARYPEIQISLSINDQIVDMMGTGTDIAIRTGTLSDSTLIARKICDIERIICAAPDYLRRHGTPKTPEDLHDHNCMTLDSAPGLNRWPFLKGKTIKTIEVHGNTVADSADTMRLLALAGAGIVRLGDNIVGKDIATGQLVPILRDEHAAEPLPLHILYQQGRLRSPKVTAMVEFVLEKFSSRPWHNAIQRRPKTKNQIAPKHRS